MPQHRKTVSCLLPPVQPASVRPPQVLLRIPFDLTAHADMNELLVILEGKPDTTVDGTPHDLSEGEAIALGPSGSQELSSQDSKPALVPVAGWI